MSTSTIRVTFINNDGGGYANPIEVPLGTTAAQFFSSQLGSRNPADYRIRVNQQAVSSGQMLRDGDRFSATPVNIKGAAGILA